MSELTTRVTFEALLQVMMCSKTDISDCDEVRNQWNTVNHLSIAGTIR